MLMMKPDHVLLLQNVRQECLDLIIRKNVHLNVWLKCTKTLQQDVVKTVLNIVVPA